MSQPIMTPPDTLNPITCKEDPFGLSLPAETSPLRVASETENKTAQTIEATGADGSIIASCIYGEQVAPSADYKVCKAGSLNIKLGSISTYKNKKVMLWQVTINTAAGQALTVSASGEQVEDTAQTSHIFNAGTVEFTTSLHPQDFFNAWTLTGDGCHVNSANYTVAADIIKGLCANGDPVASDVTRGRIEIQLEIVRVKENEPQLTLASGWEFIAPLTLTNGQAAYPIYSATIRKTLQHSEVV